MRITQNGWRAVATACLIVSVLMFIAGASYSPLRLFLRDSLTLFALYWGFCVLIVCIAVYIAFIDMRYIRLQYVLGKREFFKETLGDEGFRKALKAAYEEKQQGDDDGSAT